MRLLEIQEIQVYKVVIKAKTLNHFVCESMEAKAKNVNLLISVAMVV